MTRVSANAAKDLPIWRLGVSLHQRQVKLLDVSLLPLSSESPVRSIVLRDKEQSRRVLI
jgi:hypothetical protein